MTTEQAQTDGAESVLVRYEKLTVGGERKPCSNRFKCGRCGGQVSVDALR